jgi:arylsulfatase A-like enzyme
MKFIVYLVIIFTIFSCTPKTEKENTQKQPNIILLMADDLGWGDPSYTGNPISKTPNLDQMASEGIRFNRFYASSPVCSPTRGSCITGRHPYRYGVFFANEGHMRDEEYTLAEALKTKGYVTGHFGKWHLGTLTKTEKDANRGGDTTKVKDFSPPWNNGFDVCFSTESKVPTWNPMITPNKSAGDVGRRVEGEPFGTAYWTELGQRVTENLEGDDSRIIMDRVIPFIENATKKEKPFFTVIWFHTPHLPVLTSEKYRNLFSDYSEDIQHFYGAVYAMDEQIGRLREFLKKQKVYNNTVLFFTSDNGPEGKQRKRRTQGTAGIFKGRKRSLYEGGIRVPGIMTWPAKIKKNITTDIPFSTLDYFPTVMEIVGFSDKGTPIDGVSIVPFLNGKMKKRPVSIGFESRNQQAFMNNRYKIYSNDKGEHFELYDIIADPTETTDIAPEHPEVVLQLSQQLLHWRESCKNSFNGKDY